MEWPQFVAKSEKTLGTEQGVLNAALTCPGVLKVASSFRTDLPYVIFLTISADPAFCAEDVVAAVQKLVDPLAPAGVQIIVKSGAL